MANQMLMPKFGLSMEEGTIASWLVAEGDTVTKGQALAEVNSEKLTNNAESEYDGTVLKILVQEDDTVPVGTPICIIGAAGEDVSGLGGDAGATPAQEAPAANDAAQQFPAAGGALPAGVNEVAMPKFGLSMEEGTIASWLVAEGDAITKGQALAEINSEKLTNNAESEFEGTLLKILVEEDDTVPVGTPIALIGAAGTDVSGYGNGGAAVTDTAPASTPAAASATVAVTAAPADVKITPRAKKYAEEHQLAYAHITGTGIGGAITIDDVKKNGRPVSEAPKVTPAASVSTAAPVASAAAASKPAAAPKVAEQVFAAVQPGDEVKPMSQMQLAICKGMYNSLQGTAQTTIATEINVENLTKVYKSLKPKYKAAGIKLSYTAMIVKAVAMAIENHEVIRTQYVDDKHIKIVHKIDIGIAVDVPNGLIVPVIRDANLKDLRQICIDIADLSTRARENRLTGDDLGGAVTTITNLGMFNVTYFTPVLNAPEATIMGTGSIIEKPVIRDGGIYIDHVMNISLTHDHRISNGAPCARYLKEVNDNLQDFKWC